MILGVNQHNIVVFEFGSLIGRCLNSVFKIAVFLQCFRKLILAERLDIKELIFARKFEEKQRCRFYPLEDSKGKMLSVDAAKSSNKHDEHSSV